MSSSERARLTRIAVEGAVIVTSILLALAAEAWWERMQERGEERALLAEVRRTLSEDLVDIQLGRDTIAQASENLTRVAERFERGELVDTTEQFQREIRALGRFTQVVVRYGPFETLKGRGLTLISDPDLRVSLTSLYEDEIPILQSNTEIDRALSRERMLPFQLEHFVIDAGNRWEPRPGVNIEALRTTGATLARYRQRTLEQFYLPSYDLAIALMTGVIADIDVALQND